MNVNMKTMKFILATTVFASVSTAMAETNNAETSEVKPYRYSMNLDIAELIKVEYLRSAPAHCSVIPARMTYKDSSGAIEVIEYLYPDTSGCTD